MGSPLPLGAALLLPALGICLYLAVHHALMWLARRTETIQLLASVWFGASALFELLRILHKSTTDPARAVTLVHLEFATATLFAVLVLHVALHLVGRRMTSRLTIPLLGTTALINVLLAIPGAILHTDTWYLRVDALGERFYAARPGPLLALFLAHLLLWVAAACHAIWAGRAALRRTELLAVLGGLVVTFLCIINDVLQIWQVYTFIHLVELLPLVIGVGVSFILMERHARLHRNLEEAVAERTLALDRRNQQLQCVLDAAQRSERSLRDLVESIPDAVIVHRDDRFILLNEAACALLGIPHADTPPDRTVSSVFDASFPVGGRGASAWVETALPREGASPAVVQARGMDVVHGGLPARVLVVRDLTEQRQLHSRLAVADRMASLGTLAAGVAHEINNPLAFVLVNLSTMIDRVTRGPSGPAQLEMLQLLHETQLGADRVRQIVRDMRMLSRERDEPTAVDCQQVLQTALRMTFHEIRMRAHVVEEHASIPPALANEARLGQVFINLLINAAQAIPEGNPEGNTIWVRTSRQDGQVVVCIEDTGSGIAPSDRDKVFDPFFTTKPVGVGTGLGLFICHAIMQSLGGSIELADREGGGTRATLRVPVAPEHAALPAAAPLALPRPNDTRLRVLVVDDEPMLVRALERMLLGHRVQTAGNGAAALAELRASTQPVDAIVCDLVMPLMGGMDLYKAVQREMPHLANTFIFMTGGNQDGRLTEFLKQVPCPVLEKPFDDEAFRRALAVLASGGNAGAAL